jgi:hypothetical protein
LGFGLTDWNFVPLSCCLTSPGFSSYMAFAAVQSAFKGSQWDFFYTSVATVHAMSWLLLIAAARIVPGSWQDRAEKAKWPRSFGPAQNDGTRASRLKERRRLLEMNPIYWLTTRDRRKCSLVWVPIVAAALLAAWGMWRYPATWKDSGIYLWVFFLLTRSLKFWLAFEACRRFGEDRRSGALELLLATPLPVKEILRGQLLGLMRQFAGPAAAVLLAEFGFLVIFLRQEEFADVIGLGLGDMVMFIADLVTLSWVAMWTGLTSRHATRAGGAAVLRVLFLPGLLFGAVMMLLAFVAISSRSHPAGLVERYLPLICWFAIGVAVDLFFGFWARQRLREEFREIASEKVSRRKLWAKVSNRAEEIVLGKLPVSDE